MSSEEGKSAERITQFIFNELAEDDRASMAESIFEDDDAFFSILSAENDLTDDYVYGRMNAAEKLRFQRVLVSRSDLKTNVEFAATLRDLATGAVDAHSPERDEAQTLKVPFELGTLPAGVLATAASSPVSEPPRSWWTRLSSLLTAKRLTLGTALAALVVLFGGGLAVIVALRMSGGVAGNSNMASVRPSMGNTSSSKMPTIPMPPSNGSVPPSNGMGIGAKPPTNKEETVGIPVVEFDPNLNSTAVNVPVKFSKDRVTIGLFLPKGTADYDTTVVMDGLKVESEDMSWQNNEMKDELLVSVFRPTSDGKVHQIRVVSHNGGSWVYFFRFVNAAAKPTPTRIR